MVAQKCTPIQCASRKEGGEAAAAYVLAALHEVAVLRREERVAAPAGVDVEPHVVLLRDLGNLVEGIVRTQHLCKVIVSDIVATSGT